MMQLLFFQFLPLPSSSLQIPQTISRIRPHSRLASSINYEGWSSNSYHDEELSYNDGSIHHEINSNEISSNYDAQDETIAFYLKCLNDELNSQGVDTTSLFHNKDDEGLCSTEQIYEDISCYQQMTGESWDDVQLVEEDNRMCSNQGGEELIDLMYCQEESIFNEIDQIKSNYASQESRGNISTNQSPIRQEEEVSWDIFNQVDKTKHSLSQIIKITLVSVMEPLFHPPLSFAAESAPVVAGAPAVSGAVKAAAPVVGGASTAATKTAAAPVASGGAASATKVVASSGGASTTATAGGATATKVAAVSAPKVAGVSTAAKGVALSTAPKVSAVTTAAKVTTSTTAPKVAAVTSAVKASTLTTAPKVAAVTSAVKASTLTTTPKVAAVTTAAKVTTSSMATKAAAAGGAVAAKAGAVSTATKLAVVGAATAAAAASSNVDTSSILFNVYMTLSSMLSGLMKAFASIPMNPSTFVAAVVISVMAFVYRKIETQEWRNFDDVSTLDVFIVSPSFSTKT
jgi:hypothetical protein